MPSPAVTAPTMEAPPAPESAAGAPVREPLRSQLGEIVNSLCRLADLQFAIWRVSVKMAVRRLVLGVLLVLLALLFALVAIIFLYAGIYHVLTDLWGIPTAWALLIFAGAHGLLAGILAFAAMAHRRGPRKPDPGGVT